MSARADRMFALAQRRYDAAEPAEYDALPCPECDERGEIEDDDGGACECPRCRGHCVVRTAGERPATIHVPLLVARDWARAVLELVERELGPESEL